MNSLWSSLKKIFKSYIVLLNFMLCLCLIGSPAVCVYIYVTHDLTFPILVFIGCASILIRTTASDDEVKKWLNFHLLEEFEKDNKASNLEIIGTPRQPYTESSHLIFETTLGNLGFNTLIKKFFTVIINIEEIQGYLAEVDNKLLDEIIWGLAAIVVGFVLHITSIHSEQLKTELVPIKLIALIFFTLRLYASITIFLVHRKRINKIRLS